MECKKYFQFVNLFKNNSLVLSSDLLSDALCLDLEANLILEYENNLNILPIKDGNLV